MQTLKIWQDIASCFLMMRFNLVRIFLLSKALLWWLLSLFLKLKQVVTMFDSRLRLFLIHLLLIKKLNSFYLIFLLHSSKVGPVLFLICALLLYLVSNAINLPLLDLYFIFEIVNV
jgi:hypothetical protein